MPPIRREKSGPLRLPASEMAKWQAAAAAAGEFAYQVDAPSGSHKVAKPPKWKNNAKSVISKLTKKTKQLFIHENSGGSPSLNTDQANFLNLSITQTVDSPTNAPLWNLLVNIGYQEDHIADSTPEVIALHGTCKSLPPPSPDCVKLFSLCHSSVNSTKIVSVSSDVTSVWSEDERADHPNGEPKGPLRLTQFWCYSVSFDDDDDSESHRIWRTLQKFQTPEFGPQPAPASSSTVPSSVLQREVNVKH